MLKPLPIGIHTFSKIIEGHYLYVDKTQDIHKLITTGQVYFLSRPRRFGKSLLLSTLQEIFEGHRELFEGLWIYESDYEWEEFPVIRIDLSRLKVATAEELQRGLKRNLSQAAQLHKVNLKDGQYYEQLLDLIFQLATDSSKRVVVLVDEYDKPLIDNLGDTEEAHRIREVLKGFYTILKAMDEYLHFVILTGVSKFSKVGVFSGLNNLKDITMDNRFATMLGITEEEIDTHLGDYVQAFTENEGLDEEALRGEIKAWYNGFCFSKKCKPVYNPFSLLSLLDMQDFRNYWFETGTPTFLVELIKTRNYDVRFLEDLRVRELSFSSYEIEDLGILPLLFQTGYLTIKDYDPRSRLYNLYYPNREVEDAFLRYLVDEFSELEKGKSDSYLWNLAQALLGKDFDTFFKVLRVFLAEIPYEIQIKQEKYYQTIFYLIFKLIGLQIGAEVRTNRGRIDAMVETDTGVFIFEFKLDGSKEEALAQIKARGYMEKYALRDSIHLIGVAFDTQERNVAEWLIENP